MKTLDEVIWAVENCDSAIDDCAHCAYYKEDCENLRPLRADALHYLKDYRMLVNDFAEKRQELEDEKARYQEAVKNCETAENRHKAYELGYIRAMADYEELKRFWAESQENPELSWDELKSMEGKPVWIEQTITKKVYSGWVIAKAVTEDYLNTQERLFWQRDFDKTWRAYRHERD